jgi:hypothetical protein
MQKQRRWGGLESLPAESVVEKMKKRKEDKDEEEKVQRAQMIHSWKLLGPRFLIVVRAL